MWQRYEKDTPPSLEILQKFGALVGMSAARFLLLLDKSGENAEFNIVPARKLPVVNRIPASGFVLSSDDESIIDWIVTSNLTEKGLFGLKVQGNSMAPKIEAGDYVVCAPEMHFVDKKIYAIVTKDSAATLKIVQRSGSNFVCMPLNPEFQPIVVAEEDVIRLIRVVEIIKKT